MAVVDVSREDVLIILESMGIKLDTNNNKLPLAKLEARLDKALDASQKINNLFKEKLVEPPKLPEWDLNGKEGLFKATARFSAVESFQEGDILKPKKAQYAKREDTFKELRQTVWALGAACDEVAPAIFMVNPDKQTAIFIRITGVHKLPDGTPLFYLMYIDINPTHELTLEDHIKKLSIGESTTTLPVGDLESYALLRLLRNNAERLDPSCRHAGGEKAPGKIFISSSFLLPLNPLTQQTLGERKFSDNGCYVCGRKTASLCQGCLVVSYCSKDCQVKDWPNHKPACRSLKGATWRRFSLGDYGEHLAKVVPGMSTTPYVTLMNLSTLGNTKSKPPTPSRHGEGPAINTHGGKIFLAKFQVPLGGRPQSMLIYDSQRSFQGHWLRSGGAAEFFDEAVGVIGSRGKFYRWMRHVEGDTYELCLDKAPQSDPLW